ncbi:hypothetical protein [Odoribacter lunatus]|uniref:hypothetical protein n=1 Tax=Odoribacter lunatus TaxID=2941335 RepID=UPI00203A4962|nr:hypothetical protein [Odoribacter lunatus]
MGKKITVSVLLLLLSLCGKTQFTNFGQDPASLRWKQIKTIDFQIIYPDYFETNAQKIANIYQALYTHSNSLAHKPAKVSMILHPNGGISNGTVAWAPKRTELYTMPSQVPSDTWLEHLCIHEFRHVVQIDKINQDLTKILYYIFGEQVTIAVAGLYLPLWFMEGDAVTYETALGQLGRGRSPEFLNEMKAQIVEKGIYSYYKATLGSYKDYVPNRYNLGYFMVANSRANYGPDIWSNALTRIGQYPLGITSFATSLKKTLKNHRDELWQDSTFYSLFIHPEEVKQANTYRNAKRTLYHDNFSELQQIWKNETQHITDRFDTIPTTDADYTNYYYPIPTEDGGLVVYKKGMQQTGAFVLLNNGTEKQLTPTGNLNDNKFTYHKHQLLWTEYKPHTRWANGGRNTLCSYDIKHKKYRYHKSPNNRFSPFIAGEYIGVVEADNANRASIILLTSDLQKEIRRINAGENELFIHPSFHDNQIITIVQSPQGVHIESIHPETGARKKLTEPQWYELDNPVLYDSLLVYRASYNGNNALYEKNLYTGKVQNILNAPFGIRFPAVNLQQNTLYFSFYTANGYKPGSISLRQLNRQNPHYSDYRLADTLFLQEGWRLNCTYDSTFTTRKYNKFTHLINPHSWGPLYINTQELEANIGLVVYSQNKLSTLSLATGYISDSDYNHGAWMLNADYKALWPVFNLDFKTGKYDYYTFLFNTPNLQTQQTDTLYLYNRSNYTQGSLSIQFPFNISAQNYNRYLTPYVRYKIEALHNTDTRKLYQVRVQDNIGYLYPANPANYQYSTPANYYQILEYGLLFSNQTRMTAQELNPHWGQMLQGGFAHTPLKKTNLGHEWWISGNFYFPGFRRNHSLYTYAGYQKRPNNIAYGKKIQAPRGIKIYGNEFSTLRSGYKLPLFYPDQHIGSLLYIKAINGGVFFDMTHEKTRNYKQNFYSYGAELTAALHVLSLPFPVNTGVRIGYETQTKAIFADFLFTLNFSI